MRFRIAIDIDCEKTFFQTLVVSFENSIEFINRYKVITKIIEYDNSILFEKSEIMNHDRALKYIVALKNTQADNVVGLSYIKKQTLITKKNPYISHDEYIKRFLWE